MATKIKYDPAKVYEEAHTAGLEAMAATTPTPMVVSDDPNYMKTRNTYYVPQGMCGFAWIEGIRANSSIGKWLVANGKGRRSEFSPGVTVWVREGGQSYELKSAYAAAFEGVLKSYEIRCFAGSRLD